MDIDDIKKEFKYVNEQMSIMYAVMKPSKELKQFMHWHDRYVRALVKIEEVEKK